jgi:hypothetical protein
LRLFLDRLSTTARQCRPPSDGKDWALVEDAFIEELRRLENAGDLTSALRRVVDRRLTPDQLFNFSLSLYEANLAALPLVILQQLSRAGVESWALHGISAVLALRLGEQEIAEASILRFSALLAGNERDRQVARRFLGDTVSRQVLAAFASGEKGRMQQWARLWSAVEPEVMRAFAKPEAARQVDIERFRQVSGSAALLTLQSPSPGQPRQRRKAVLAARRYWIPQLPATREHEIPVRIAAAMERYGWEVVRFHFRSFADPALIADDYRAIPALCREAGAELIVLDDFLVEREGTAVPGESIRRLRTDCPALRIAGLYLDCWDSEQWDAIEGAAPLLDAAWTTMATALWRRPAFKDKVLLCPLPLGEGFASDVPLAPALSFIGGVQQVNWYRAFWLSAIAEAGLPLRQEISAHEREAGDPLVSYKDYMRRLGAAGASLNFARRFNGAVSLTGRTFEVPAAGGLLVQERSDDIDLFLTAGRHYLRFESVSDLADIVELLRRKPEVAEEIRRAGRDFVRERYADDKIIGYLDHFLFHRHSAATGMPASTSSSPEGS